MDDGNIVLKFGGTSLGRAERLENVISIIQQAAVSGRRPVVVLSALSGDIKATGTTSLLLQATSDVLDSDTTAAYVTRLDAIETLHRQVAEGCITSQEHLHTFLMMLKDRLARLRTFLDAAEVIQEMTARSIDIVVSEGEHLACLLTASVLQSRGIAAVNVSLERLVTRRLLTTFELPLTQPFYDHVAEKLNELLLHLIQQGKIPIVTGFFGPVPGSLLTSLGRGYTDLTAALVAVGLKSKELQIWKEVDGIFTADPRLVPNARHLPSVAPNEVAELTYFGAEVIHPFTMHQAVDAHIPIRLKNTLAPNGPGTLIVPKENVTDSISPVVQSMRSRRKPTAVTIKDKVTVVSVRAHRRQRAAHQFYSHVFDILAQRGITVDLISTSHVQLSMAIASVSEQEIQHVAKLLGPYGTVDISYDMAILSLVGDQMRHAIGMSGRLFSTLAQAGVNIDMISQGASEINISCVIAASDASIGLIAVHRALIELDDL